MDGTKIEKIGIVGTYKQDWALTQYLNRFCEQFAVGSTLILAEDVSAVTASTNIIPCWKRNSQDYTRLIAVVTQENIRVLNVNCCYPYFDNQFFNDAMLALGKQGVRIVAHVHDNSAFTTVPEFLCSIADVVVVDSSRAKLKAVQAGVLESRVEIILTAGKVQENLHQAVRQQLGVPTRQRMLVGFDLGASTDRLEMLVQALYELNPARAAVHLYIVHLDPVGKGSASSPSQALSRHIASLHLEEFVHIVHSENTDALVSDYVQAADVIVLSHGRPLYELREVLGRSLSSGRPVLTSSPLPFDGLDSCCLFPDIDSTLAKSIDEAINSDGLKAALGTAGLAWAKSRSIEATGAEYQKIFARLGRHVSNSTVANTAEASNAVTFSLLSEDESSPVKSAPAAQFPEQALKAPIRILMQNRHNAHSHPGGDTVVMDRLSAELRSMGHTVDLDLDCVKNPKDYDLAHLYNFAIRDATEHMAKQCFNAGLPYVVTTLYEDWPVFFNQMASLFYGLQAYVAAGQPKDRWQEMYEAARAVPPSEPWDNSWAANHSHALLASGANEKSALERDYPQAPRIEICPFGCEVAERGDAGERFIRETGLKDFIFCVGRLEGRKNQLMLLKALEDSDLTIVFATGGFTYQPEYEAACRAFRRKGKNIFLGRMEPEMLASAFGAAKVHALPSWFELPGLVSLEAARYGTNVVVSDFGTARDYLGDLVYYCSPDDEQSISAAVMQAYTQPVSPKLSQHVEQYTWRKAAETVQELYYSVLKRPSVGLAPVMVSDSIQGARSQAQAASQSVVRIPEVVGYEIKDSASQTLANTHCAEGDARFAEGAMTEACASYSRALECLPGYARAQRSLGVCALSTKDFPLAEKQFRGALRADPSDNKALVGLGAVIWELDRKDEAFELYRRASEADSTGASLLYFMNAAYALNKLPELEAVLRRVVKQDRENLDLQYCLAGCYFRQQKYALAGGIVERILRINPTHAGAVELREEVLRRSSGIEQGSTNTMGSNAVSSLRSTLDSSLSARYDLELERLELEKKDKHYDDVIAKAGVIADSAQAGDHQRALARILKAESLACSGETAAADSEFILAIDDPMYGYRACAGRGAVAAATGNHDGANTLFQRALVLRPEYDIAITGLGICAQMAGDSEQAWDLYSRAFAVNSENTKALFGLIQLGYQMGRMPEIETALREYLGMHPVDLGMLYSLAGCLYAQGRSDEASEECRRILLFEPRHELANELLAKLQENEMQGLYAQR